MANSFYDNSTPGEKFQPGTLADGQAVDQKFDSVEAGFDSVEQETTRALKFPYEQGMASQEFNESALQRRNKVLAFDDDGNVALKSGFSYRGDWAANTDYFVNDVLRDPSTKNLYVVKFRHTSGSTFDTANLTLGVNVQDVEALKNQAAASASNASTSEGNAADSASAASTSENNAAASASAAGTSETNAASSASAASTSANNASSSESAAASSAMAASNSENAAAASANNASNSETAAAGSASAASNSATDAAARRDETAALKNDTGVFKDQAVTARNEAEAFLNQTTHGTFSYVSDDTEGVTLEVSESMVMSEDGATIDGYEYVELEIAV